VTHNKDVSTEDDLGARRLIARYAQLVDDRDVDAAAELFEADGRVIVDGTEHRGRSAVRDWIADVTAALPACQHQMTNVVVSYGSKPDTLHAVSDLSLLAKGEQGWTVVLTGRYHDTFSGHGRDLQLRQRVVTLG
jgi:ketosteroid isomerase-like protein